jgi:hypothetical protein
MDNHELTTPDSIVEELRAQNEELRAQNEDLKGELYRLRWMERKYIEQGAQFDSLRARIDSFKNTPVSSSINNSYCKI